MKKVIAIAAAGVIGLIGLSFTNFAVDKRPVLKVANWAEYIDGGDADSPLIHEFEDWYKQQTGKDIRVEYCIADDNETLYNMIKMGDHFDLVCPSEYMLMKSNFYKYDYPDVTFDYEFTYDYDEEMEWYNCELGTNMSLDAIKTIVKRQYALDVICNVAYECFFFYDDSVEYYEYEGDYYCDTFSSKYCVEIDTDVKCIYLYEIVDEKGPAHNRTFVSRVLLNEQEIGMGKGKSKKEAEQQAAHEALKLMGYE